MLTRSHGYLKVRSGRLPKAAASLEADGYVVLDGVFDAEKVAALRADVERVFAEYPPDERGDTPEEAAPFRYEMLNRSAPVQRAIANPRILKAVEPLLGEDCHVIANTAWWQKPGDNDHLARFWHIDAGPHVPRAAGIPWDSRIPYPIFAVATHLYLWDCPLESGPTGVIPGSHTSGLAPPMRRAADDDLEFEGRGAVPIVAKAGDVALFVSDLWHRRMPPLPGDRGRMFIQCHYGRRGSGPTDPADVRSQPALRRRRATGPHTEAAEPGRPPPARVLRRLRPGPPIGRARPAGQPVGSGCQGRTETQHVAGGFPTPVLHSDEAGELTRNFTTWYSVGP